LYLQFEWYKSLVLHQQFAHGKYPVRLISARAAPNALTLININSRSICAPSDKSTTLTTSTIY
jgi:hypothetical protein